MSYACGGNAEHMERQAERRAVITADDCAEALKDRLLDTTDLYIKLVRVRGAAITVQGTLDCYATLQATLELLDRYGALQKALDAAAEEAAAALKMCMEESGEHSVEGAREIAKLTPTVCRFSGLRKLELTWKPKP